MDFETQLKNKQNYLYTNTMQLMERLHANGSTHKLFLPNDEILVYYTLVRSSTSHGVVLTYVIPSLKEVYYTTMLCNHSFSMSGVVDILEGLYSEVLKVKEVANNEELLSLSEYRSRATSIINSVEKDLVDMLSNTGVVFKEYSEDDMTVLTSNFPLKGYLFYKGLAIPNMNMTVFNLQYKSTISCFQGTSLMLITKVDDTIMAHQYRKYLVEPDCTHLEYRKMYNPNETKEWYIENTSENSPEVQKHLDKANKGYNHYLEHLDEFSILSGFKLGEESSILGFTLEDKDMFVRLATLSDDIIFKVYSNGYYHYDV